MNNENNDFICLSCVWGVEEESENRAYCTKVRSDCNGPQSRPVHFCDDYEIEEELEWWEAMDTLPCGCCTCCGCLGHDDEEE